MTQNAIHKIVYCSIFFIDSWHIRHAWLRCFVKNDENALTREIFTLYYA